MARDVGCRVIHYHGGPVTPVEAAVSLWTRRHALVSYAHRAQTSLAFELAQSVLMDNSAFSKWQSGEGDVDVPAVAEHVRIWHRHPSYDGCLIPDKIDGTAAENDKLIANWLLHERIERSIPVWHMHEDVARLGYLVQCATAHVYPMVAIGSSGQWATPGTDAWWLRIGEAMAVACDEEGRPKCKLHGLRMLSPAVFGRVPLSSADSCNVARNIGLDKKWTGSYAPMTPMQRALVLAERIELQPAASRWVPRHDVQQLLELT